MTQTIQPSLEDKLKSLYLDHLDRRAKAVLRGENITAITDATLSDEYKIAGLNKDDYTHAPIMRKVRLRVFSDLWFDRLIDSERTNPGLLKELEKKVPMEALTEAVILYMGLANSDRLTREEFAIRFDISDHSRSHLSNLLLPLGVLEVVKRDPSVLDKITNYNKYGLQLLYRPKVYAEKKPTIKDIEKEIAPGLAALFTPETLGLLEDVTHHIVLSKNQGYVNLSGVKFECASTIRTRVGKYKLENLGGNFHFIISESLDIPGLTEHFDILFNDPQTRKDIHYLAIRYLDYTQERLRESDMELGSLKQSSNMWLSKMQYKTLMDALRGFARNQLIGSFEKNEHMAVIESYISRRLGLRPRVMPGKELIIEDPHYQSTLTLGPGSRLFHTSHNLPFMSYILHRAYLEADRIVNSSL